MKIFSVVLALVIAIFISKTASAESWVEVVDKYEIVTSIDKDSIKRGTESKKFPKFNRKDGYSAILKLKFKDVDNLEMVHLVSFYEKNGERMFCFLDDYDKSNSPAKESEVLEEKVDREGSVFPEIWAYIEKNLK